VDDDSLAPRDSERVVDALKRGQPGDGDRSGLGEGETPGNARRVPGVHHDVFRVEAALRISIAVGVDAGAAAKSPNARADGGDDARAIDSEHERELRVLGPRARSHLRVPDADAGRVDPDPHFVSRDRRDQDVADLQDRRRSETIDRNGAHRLRKAAGAESASHAAPGLLDPGVGDPTIPAIGTLSLRLEHTPPPCTNRTDPGPPRAPSEGLRSFRRIRPGAASK
jgi:hypothetical protein